jgi:glycerol-3-phosphate acyltransferase PlsX
MRIGIDAMGGDHAPKNIVLGAVEVYTQLSSGTRIVLFGDKEQIMRICEAAEFDHNNFDIVHTTEVIEMSDHPARAFQHKKNSSITVGFNALHSKDIDAFASAGNTGAMLVGTSYTVKSIIGIIRPCISATFPIITGAEGILLDVGLNPDCRPDILAQYGILGSIYAKHMLNIDSPRVGLLNIGEEEEKGNLLTKAAYELMKDEAYNFVGNVEGHQIFSGKKADVIVCDGFVGNVLLKQSEALYGMTQKLGIKHDYFNRFNYELQGGTPVLGVNAPVIIGHGASTPLAIKNMILQTEHAIKVDIVSKFKEVL